LAVSCSKGRAQLDDESRICAILQLATFEEWRRAVGIDIAEAETERIADVDKIKAPIQLVPEERIILPAEVGRHRQRRRTKLQLLFPAGALNAPKPPYPREIR